MGFQQDYLPAADEANRQALIHNIQEDLMKLPEFDALMPKLSVSDSGMNMVFAYSLVDIKVKQMTQHTLYNYKLLMDDAITAVEILNAELDNLAAATKTIDNTQQVVKPIIDATSYFFGQQPVVKFCEERDSKGVIERVEEMIDSFHSTIVRVKSAMEKSDSREAQTIH